MLPRFDPSAVQSSPATLVSLVATALRRIDPTRFRRIVLGGATPPDDLPANVVTTYGMTETGSGVVYDGVPLDGVEVRFADDGEIHVRGPMLLRAYRRADADVDPRASGWLATGDLGRWLPDGRLAVDGRRSDLIISGGENVWPEPVERAIRADPRVADVAVAGTPDPEWGHVVTAYVVPAGPRGTDARRPAPRGARGVARLLRATTAAAGRGDPDHHARQATTISAAVSAKAQLTGLIDRLPTAARAAESPRRRAVRRAVRA